MITCPHMSDRSKEDLEELKRQAEIFFAYAKEQKAKQRKWENAFQKWSDEHGMGDGTESWGACGYGVMCDWCEDNSYGRPCVRALNAMCREKGIEINYDDIDDNTDFSKVWEGEFAK